MSYSLAAADLVLAPFIPSDTARGGGIVFPVVRSVASDFGSEPGPTSKLIGEFLVLVSYHTTYTASAIFPDRHGCQSAGSPNSRIQIGHVELTWTTWLTGSICVFELMSLTRWFRCSIRKLGCR